MYNSDSNYFGMKSSHRREALMDTAEQFITRGSSVVFLKPGSTEPLSDAITKDLESAEKIFKAYPSANIAVVVGTENNLIAIKLEQESPHDPDPQEMLVDLEQMYGSLPTTMTITYPNGSQCRLFDYPQNSNICRSSLESSVTRTLILITRQISLLYLVFLMKQNLRMMWLHWQDGNIR